MRSGSIAALLVLLLVIASAQALAKDTEGTSSVSFEELGARCAPGVHIRTIASLVRHESDLNPFAININGGAQLARQPTNKEDAIATAERLLDQGANFDAGLGQINSRNFSWTGLSLSRLFDPCENLKAAATVLSACYQRSAAVFGEGQQALRAALSCYNTGTLDRGFRNGYVRAVVAEAALPVPEILPWEGGAPSTAATDAPVRLHRVATISQSSSTDADDRNDGAPEGDAFAHGDDPDAFSEKSTKY